MRLIIAANDDDKHVSAARRLHAFLQKYVATVPAGLKVKIDTILVEPTP